MLRRVIHELLEDSPKKNLEKLRSRIAGVATGEGATGSRAPANKVLDGLLESPVLPKLLAHSLRNQWQTPVVLAGQDRASFDKTLEMLASLARPAEWRTWRWHDGGDILAGPADARVVLCCLPTTDDEWRRVAGLKRVFGSRLLLLTELLLPYTRLTFLQGKLDYYLKNLEEILPYYLGEKWFGPLDLLNSRFPIVGKKVIEFGPFDGAQTAGLVHMGAERVTCIEARAENVTKTLTAADVFGWSNVRVVMDDFHNADATKYGRFDLAFAHGVYYHSIAPFVFLENLRSLSDTIFIGGFCATDDSPTSPWLELLHEGKTYRAKEYREGRDFTAGVNSVAYYFHGEDLIEFFRDRGHRVTVITDEPSPITAGRFLRILVERA